MLNYKMAITCGRCGKQAEILSGEPFPDDWCGVAEDIYLCQQCAFEITNELIEWTRPSWRSWRVVNGSCIT